MTTSGLEIVHLVLSFLAFFYTCYSSSYVCFVQKVSVHSSKDLDSIYILLAIFFSVNISNNHQTQNYWLKYVMNGFT